MKIKHLAIFLILGLWSCSKNEIVEDLKVSELTETANFRSAPPCPLPIFPVPWNTLAADFADFGPFDNYDGYLDQYYQCEYPPIGIDCPISAVVYTETLLHCCLKVQNLVGDINAITDVEIIDIIEQAIVYAQDNAPDCPDDGTTMFLTNIDFFVIPPTNPSPKPRIGFYAEYQCCDDEAGGS